MARVARKLTATERHKIPAWSLSYNGWGDGSGYPGKPNNPANKYVGHGLEFSCADGVTATFGKAGFPLISMQAGMSEGYAYCYDAYVEGKRLKAIIPSWDAQVGDILLIHTGSAGAQPGHTECVYAITGTNATRRVWSIGWDSGPSNVDGFTGQGGVHKHIWSAPKGRGNAAIMAVLDADKVIDWRKVMSGAPRPRKLRPAPLSKNSQSKVSTLTDALDSRKHPVSAGARHQLADLLGVVKHLLRK